jgi:hypothetical protein
VSDRYRENQKKFYGAPVPPGLKHGPNTWAKQVYGCGCTTCLPSGKRKRKAWRGERPFTPLERRARSRKALRGQAVPPGTKHGIYTYKVYGCRCEDCELAQKRASHRAKNPWMYRETRGRWHVGEEVTTVCWPPADADPTWRCPHDA